MILYLSVFSLFLLLVLVRLNILGLLSRYIRNNILVSTLTEHRNRKGRFYTLYYQYGDKRYTLILPHNVNIERKILSGTEDVTKHDVISEYAGPNRDFFSHPEYFRYVTSVYGDLSIKE